MSLLKRVPGQSCPLCGNRLVFHFHQDERRPYLRCYRCLLVFVPPAHHPTEAVERAQYDLHQNQDTPAYRRFLQPALDAVLQRVKPGLPVLDFGCGPGPVLATMLTETGYACHMYDPIYQPDPQVLQPEQYAAVTATEVVEHLRHPLETLDRMWQLLLPGGVLVLMSDRAGDQADFARWHYIRDPTHIAFYSDASLQWLAHRWRAKLELPDNRLAVFTRVDGP